jgi:hypothetical protein
LLFPKNSDYQSEFFASPENFLYVENFRHKKGDVKKYLIISSHPLFPFHSSQKLLIRPMLMHGRAQAFCFSESATGRADSVAV